MESCRSALGFKRANDDRHLAHVDNLQIHPVFSPKCKDHLRVLADEDDGAHLGRRRECAREIFAEVVVARGVDRTVLDLSPEMNELVFRRLQVLLDAREN